MNYKKSSVSVAMKNLREQAYISVDEDGYIKLTSSGLKKAKSTYERHQLLTKWLVSLGVNEVIAAEDACKMEHDISDTSFRAIKKCINQLLLK